MGVPEITVQMRPDQPAPMTPERVYSWAHYKMLSARMTKMLARDALSKARAQDEIDEAERIADGIIQDMRERYTDGEIIRRLNDAIESGFETHPRDARIEAIRQAYQGRPMTPGLVEAMNIELAPYGLKACPDWSLFTIDIIPLPEEAA